MKVNFRPVGAEIFIFNKKAQQRKSFRPPFSKGGAVKGAEPLSPSAEGETPPCASE
jgi:hypothetical protein